MELLYDQIFDIDGFCNTERENVKHSDPRNVFRNKTKKASITDQNQNLTIPAAIYFFEKYKAGYFNQAKSISPLLYFISQYIPVKQWCDYKFPEQNNSTCAMIFLFSREPSSFDKLRLKDKKIYSEYLDEWSRSTNDFYFILASCIVMGFAYFLQFQEADLPPKFVVCFVMLFNFCMHFHVFFVKNPPYLE